MQVAAIEPSQLRDGNRFIRHVSNRHGSRCIQKSIVARSEKLRVEKVKFMPYEIDKLPKCQVFDEELECALCGYRSKVRVELAAHLKAWCKEQQPRSNSMPLLSTGAHPLDAIVKFVFI